MGIGKKMMWGLAATTATRAARAGTRRALHTRYGAPRLPRQASKRSGLRTALLWAAGAGIVLALADVFKEQKKIVGEREAEL